MMVLSSSADVPLHDPVDDLTAPNLRRSRRSALCPSCSRGKAPHQALCCLCEERLLAIMGGSDLLAVLARRRIDVANGGYERAMARALHALGACRLCLPANTPAPRIVEVPPNRLRPRILMASLLSTVCPACGREKPWREMICVACALRLKPSGRAPSAAVPSLDGGEAHARFMRQILRQLSSTFRYPVQRRAIRGAAIRKEGIS